MPALLERRAFFTGRETGALTAEETIREAGLDWEVEKIELSGLIPASPAAHYSYPVKFPDHRGIVRTTDRAPLGIVGKGYTPVQPREAFSFMDSVVDSGDANYHGAGHQRGGRTIWALMQIPGDIVVGGEETERVGRFMVLRNSYDATTGLGLYVTPMRFACDNALNAAIRGAVQSFSMRHTSGIQGRLQQARKAMQISFGYFAEFEEVANELLTRKMSPRGLDQFLAQLVPYPPELVLAVAKDGDGGRAARNIEEKREQIRRIAISEPNLDNVRHTAWAAYNAVAQWQDHERPIRSSDEAKIADRQFSRAVIETGIKSRALRLLAPDLAHTSGENLAVLASAN